MYLAVVCICIKRSETDYPMPYLAAFRSKFIMHTGIMHLVKLLQNHYLQSHRGELPNYLKQFM